MWQMTWDELTAEPMEPIGHFNVYNGLTGYVCARCHAPVGTFSDGSVHEAGWLYKRDECRNHHKIKWSE